MYTFKEGQNVTVVSNLPLPGNDKSPTLRIGNKLTIRKIVLDSKGNQHLDVGVSSTVAYVRSYETGEELPEGDKIHWCHPLRFLPAV